MDKQLISSEVIAHSNISFGTSGARGLVTDFTHNVCAAFSVAFIKSIDNEFFFNTVALAIDNRPSSYGIAQACAEGLKQLGLNVVYYGVIPTPALAYKAMKDAMPCIMVTGSHIPFDRNGLKFYRPDGEITKADEQAILNAKINLTPLSITQVKLAISSDAKVAYIQRYTELFSSDALAGKKVGIYEHSSAGRDIYKELFESLGAQVTSLERSDTFVPIDTEAVSPEDKQKALDWSLQYGFDAIFSTDGDGDRPLVADEHGNWLNGDILGLITSQLLNIEALAVPVSCNTAIEGTNSFKQITRTKIGSPYVIAEFSDLKERFIRVAGFEANGGYLLGSDINVNGKILSALPTRDALLPALLVLAQTQSIARMLIELPQRFVASDRVKEFPAEKSKELLIKLSDNVELLTSALKLPKHKSVDITDGLRITLDNNDILHLRPSGNAPELRCYTESDSKNMADYLLKATFEYIIK